MSLRPEELDVIKYQLGIPLTRVGAEPYIGYVALFDRVIQPYLFDNSTTSSTTVAASAGVTAITVAANPAAPNNPQALVFNVGTSVVVDVGAALEITTVAAISGLTFTVNLVNAHAAPYPIWPNGAEWMVRAILTRIATIESQLTSVAPITAGAKKVDEIELFASTKSGDRRGTKDAFESLWQQREAAREDLAGAIGFVNAWRDKRRNAGASLNRTVLD